MGIYYGYSLFRKNKGFLGCDLKPDDSEPNLSEHVLGRISVVKKGYRIAIEVRSYLSIEDKVKCYIHELLHAAYHYNWMLDDNRPTGNKYINPYSIKFYPTVDAEEDAMNRDMEIIYQTQPRLVERLKKDLREAFIDINEGMKSL